MFAALNGKLVDDQKLVFVRVLKIDQQSMILPCFFFPVAVGLPVLYGYTSQQQLMKGPVVLPKVEALRL